MLKSPVDWWVPLDNSFLIHSALKQICDFLLVSAFVYFLSYWLSTHTHSLHYLLIFVFSFAAVDA